MANTTVTVSNTDATTVTVSSVAPDATSIRGVGISATAPSAGQALVASSATAASWVNIATQAELDAFLGTTNIVTLGTITTGTWSATTIATTRGGTGLTSYVLGDALYASAANVLSALAGNITTTRKFLRQTGNGAVSAAPAWDTVTKADVGLGSVEDTALSTWPGTTNVVTVGTVATGAWNATAIGATKGGTAQTTWALGDTLYASATDTLAKLAGNTTTTRKFLTQVGNGSISAAPSWDTVTKTDVGLSAVENTALSTWAGSPAITTLGTIATGTVPAANVSAGSFGSGDFTFTGKVTFAGTPTMADGAIGITAVNGLTLRAIEGSSYDFAVLSKGSGALVIGIEGTVVTIPSDVTISGGRLYVQGTSAASIIDRALQVGNAANTGTRLSVGLSQIDTATGAAARKVYVAGVLAAAANNDVLYGMEIAPTVSVGVFTGTTFYGLKIGDVAGAATNYALYTGAGAVRLGGDVTVVGATSLEGGVTIGNATGDALTFHPSAWTLTNAVTITGTWANLGTVSAATSISSSAFVGPLNGTVGAVTPAAGSFTTRAFSGDLSVAITKFTVAAASGQVVTAGAVGVACTPSFASVRGVAVGASFGALIGGSASGPQGSFGANYYNDGVTRARSDATKAGLMWELDATDSVYLMHITAAGVATTPARITLGGAATFLGAVTGAPFILTSGPRITAATAAAFGFGTAAGADVTASLGNSSNRIGDIVSGSTLAMYAAQSDVNPTAQFTTSFGVRWGAGGASALDTRIYRVGASAVQIDDTAGGAASLTVTGSIKSTSPTTGIGYATGAGGAITQITSRTTGVTLNKVTGAITLVSAAGSATPASFTVTNSAVIATDVIKLNQKSGTDKYVLLVTAVGTGSFEITFYTTGGTTTEQPVINFAVLKGVAA